MSLLQLYHGSTEIVAAPEIRLSNRTLDYGSGFYTTTSHEQARDWVRRKLNATHQTLGFVNVYEFNPQVLNDLNCLIFQAPTEEWVDFVMLNRTQKGFTHSYDIVYGPVANDRVYAAFALYEGGFLSKQNLIAELKTYRLVDQYLFHTERAIAYLAFKEVQKVQL